MIQKMNMAHEKIKSTPQNCHYQQQTRNTRGWVSIQPRTRTIPSTPPKIFIKSEGKKCVRNPTPEGVRA